MDLFEEIQKEKEDFPKLHSFPKKISRYKLNFYQIFAIGIFIVCFFLGIILGNLFATCQPSSFYYYEACSFTEFNFSLMIAIWAIGLLLSIFIFAIGHIIVLLTDISKKLSKFRV